MEIILGAEADFSVSDDEGNSPMHIAAAKGFTDCLVLLLKKGGAVDETNESGKTSLHVAGLLLEPALPPPIPLLVPSCTPSSPFVMCSRQWSHGCCAGADCV